MTEFGHHRYIWSKPFLAERHHWELVGPGGAIHFTAQMYKGEPSCGLEIHRVAGEGAPHHINCPLTGGRCWHDGTSLYANEWLWPQIEPLLKQGRHDEIFRVLEHEYRKRFADERRDGTLKELIR